MRDLRRFVAGLGRGSSACSTAGDVPPFARDVPRGERQMPTSEMHHIESNIDEIAEVVSAVSFRRSLGTSLAGLTYRTGTGHRHTCTVSASLALLVSLGRRIVKSRPRNHTTPVAAAASHQFNFLFREDEKATLL